TRRDPSRVVSGERLQPSAAPITRRPKLRSPASSATPKFQRFLASVNPLSRQPTCEGHLLVQTGSRSPKIHCTEKLTFGCLPSTAAQRGSTRGWLCSDGEIIGMLKTAYPLNRLDVRRSH